MLFLHRLCDYQHCWSMFGIPKYVLGALLEANFQILGSDLVRKKKSISDIFVFPQSQERPVQNSKLCSVGFKSTFARATCFRLDSCTVGHTKLRFKLHELRSAGSNGCLGDWFLDMI